MDEVGELDCIADEEDRQVVADQVPVSLIRIELNCKAARIAGRLGRTAEIHHRREPHEDRSLLAGRREEGRHRMLREIRARDKDALSTGAARVNDAFWNTLTIEAGELLDKVEV